MLDYTLDKTRALLCVRPRSPLAAEDFIRLAKAVDPYLEAEGRLAGLLVDAPAFPGWDSFAALAAHLRFVRDHHRRIARIALVTDSPVGDVAEHLVAHFLSAEIRQFPAGQTESAERWILEGRKP